jgi:hypothetical protein
MVASRGAGSVVDQNIKMTIMVIMIFIAQEYDYAIGNGLRLLLCTEFSSMKTTLHFSVAGGE